MTGHPHPDKPAPHPDKPSIRLAVIADLEPLTTTLTAAFHTTPDAQWLLPHPDDRNLIYPQLAATRLTPAITTGSVHTTTDHTAVAIWQAPGTHPWPPAPTEHDPGPDTPHGSFTERLRLLTDMLTRARPDTPHHHLHYLAVHPTHQRRGLGSALLHHHHTHLDTLGEPAALTAISPGSRDLYQRHHYTITGTLHLPNGPTLWTMWRPPQPPRPPTPTTPPPPTT